MAYDMVKFDRGQVWMIRFKRAEQVGHEQQKDRPWLILSAGRYNETSGMITAVPITSRDNAVTPAQVKFTNNRGINNVILCEQIRSFDYRSGEYLLDFMGNLSTDILDKVDVALSIHLGVHYSPVTLQNLHDTMESIVKSVAFMQIKESTPKFTDQDIQEFTERLKEMTQSSFTLYHSEEAAVSLETTPTEEVEESGEYITKSVNTGRISWTKETCKEFLDDCDTLGRDSVMKKWNIEKSTRFYSMKHYAQNLLAKLLSK